MENPIQFKVALTKADLVRAARGYLLGRPNNQVFMLLSMLLAASGVLIMAINGVEPFLAAYVSILLAGLLCVFFPFPILLASRMEKSGRFGRETVWTVANDQTVLQSGEAVSRLDWGKFQYLETFGYILLTDIADGKVISIIPMHVFSTAAQSQQFRQLLRGKLGHIQKPSRFGDWQTNVGGLILMLNFIILLIYLWIGIGR